MADRCVGCGHNFYHDRPVRNMLCSYCIEEGGHRLWWYKYLRADRNEIDMGPWRFKEEAEKARNDHASFGAMCTPVFETGDDYRAYQG